MKKTLSFVCLLAIFQIVDAQADQVIEKTKMYAAKGIVNGVISNFKNLKEEESRLIVIYSGAEFTLGWVVWAIESQNHVEGGAFSANGKHLKEWSGSNFPIKDVRHKKFEEIYQRCQALLKDGAAKQPTLEESLVTLELYVGKGEKLQYNRILGFKGVPRGDGKALELEARKLMQLWEPRGK